MRRRVDPDRRPGDILREGEDAVAGEFQPGDQGAGDGGATVQRSTGIGAVEPRQQRRQRRGVGQAGETPMYVVRYADQGFAVSSIRVHLAAIKTAHLLAGLSLDLRHPRLAMVVEGVTRSTGFRLRRQAAPAVLGVLRLLLAARPASEAAIGARDRAMLLLGFGAALRRAELVALTIGDVATVPGRGLLLTIARSKTDQHGAGQRVAVHANPHEPGCCPAAALESWLRHLARRATPRNSRPHSISLQT